MFFAIHLFNFISPVLLLLQVLEHKLIYLETKDVVETTLALDNYKRACDSGRGAVFLSVARGTLHCCFAICRCIIAKNGTEEVAFLLSPFLLNLTFDIH